MRMNFDRTPAANGSAGTDAPSVGGRQPGKLNLPNILSAIRLIGSPLLVIFAFRNDSTAFVWLLVLLLFTDWVDGKLAIILKQKTTFGARLDTFADVAMYAALLFGACWLKWGVIRLEAVWLIAGVISYGLSIAVSVNKFGRVPTYHTRAAKTCWLLVGIAAVALFADWSLWPLRITAIAVMLTNLEAILITCVLPQWQTNVTSLYHAIRNVRRKG